MKCKNCGEKVEDPEINSGKVNCPNCGWVIGKVVWDKKALEMSDEERDRALRNYRLGETKETTGPRVR